MSKRLPNIWLQQQPDGGLTMHYGDSRGYETFDNRDSARARVLEWIVIRQAELGRDLRELSDVMAFLIK